MKKNLLILVALLASLSMNAGAGDNASSIMLRSGDRGGGMSPGSSQSSQPFQAFGDLQLKGNDIFYTKAGVTQKIGESVYTYDADGKCIRSEQTIRNADGIIAENSDYGITIPVDAILKNVSVNTEDLIADTTYFIDPVSGQKHIIELRREEYYNGELISCISWGLDEYGNVREWNRTESVLDSQGRPLEVIHWSSYYTVDPVTGKESYVLKPGRKYEYEYRADGLVTRTASYMRYDDNGDNGVWVYNEKRTKGINSDGEECYEYMWFSEGGNRWYGGDKYTFSTSETSSGSESFRTNWSWSYSNQDWYLSGKSFNQYNNRGNMVYSEEYYYDDDKQVFYLSEKHGWEYQGDTLEIGRWNIYYSIDESGKPVPYYGEKSEYMDYTWEELGLSASDFQYYTCPRKYDINYTLSISDNGSTNWVPQNKREYKHVVLSLVDRTSPVIFVSDRKESYWNSYNQEWSVTEYRYKYNEYGDEIQTDIYKDGALTERNIHEYEYRTIVDYEWGYSSTDQYTIREEYWRTGHEGELVCWELKEYKYDDEGRQIFNSYRNFWDFNLGTWQNGSREEHGYDETGHDTLCVSYSWDPEKKAWAGDYKELKYSDGSGKEIHASFNGGLDDNNNTVWIPSSYSERVADESGNTVCQIEYSEWDEETGSWSYGEKRLDETKTTATGEQTCYSVYRWSSGEWIGDSRCQDEYDKDGRLLEHLEYGYSTDWYVSCKTVYTYTSSGQEKDILTYRLDEDSQEFYLAEKSLATFTGDRITEYADSAYQIIDYDFETETNVWGWVPSSRRLLTYDDETGAVEVLYSVWSPYDEAWRDRSKEIQRLDSKGRIVYTESYAYDYDYYTGQMAWIGQNKEEYGYGPNGNVVMRAMYSWYGYESRWAGHYKSENDFDPVSGKHTLSATYSWDDDRQDWRGDSEKREWAFDSNGRQIMSATYYWDDDKWTWVGSSKQAYEYNDDGQTSAVITYKPTSAGEWALYEKEVNYSSDNIYYYETYSWDAEKGAWRGKEKRDHGHKSDDHYEMSASYEWNEAEWCWDGTEKYEQNYSDDAVEIIRYKWSRSSRNWVKDSKTYDEYESDGNYYKETVTKSNWNQSQSRWELDSRNTLLQMSRSDNNIDYQLLTNERYDGTTWSEQFNVRMTFNYATLTKVENNAAVDLDINVYEGVISVSANAGSVIRIVALSGSAVASGVGSVSASVAPGTYLIVVDGKAVKVQVR